MFPAKSQTVELPRLDLERATPQRDAICSLILVPLPNCCEIALGKVSKFGGAGLMIMVLLVCILAFFMFGFEDWG